MIPSSGKLLFADGQRAYTDCFDIGTDVQLMLEREHQLSQNLGITLPSFPPDIERINGEIDNYIGLEMPKLILAENDAAHEAQRRSMWNDISAMGYDEFTEYLIGAIESALQGYASYWEE